MILRCQKIIVWISDGNCDENIEIPQKVSKMREKSTKNGKILIIFPNFCIKSLIITYFHKTKKITKWK